MAGQLGGSTPVVEGDGEVNASGPLGLRSSCGLTELSLEERVWWGWNVDSVSDDWAEMGLPASKRGADLLVRGAVVRWFCGEIAEKVERLIMVDGGSGQRTRVEEERRSCCSFAAVVVVGV
ncbi:hypothetical protein M0R45_015815 [Rubus argutus]|uniref:Uncharacterized protein n=1 Tax=Rubus argutus TaxID=59490 RepID=A0AAW1XQB5_RUBAR